MTRRLRTLGRDRAGTAGIEFAFVLPVMLLLFCGIFEVSQGIIMYMKVVDAADTISDLVSQQKSVAGSDITNYYVAGQLVMEPSPGSGLGLAVASVVFDSNDNPSVAWQVTRGGAAAMADATSSAVGLGNAGESVIVAQASYTYTSALKYVMPNSLTMTSRIITRPRLAVSGIACPPPTVGGPCS